MRGVRDAEGGRRQELRAPPQVPSSWGLTAEGLLSWSSQGYVQRLEHRLTSPLTSNLWG